MENLKSEITVIKSEITVIKSEITVIKSEITVIKDQLFEFKDILFDIKNTINKQEKNSLIKNQINFEKLKKGFDINKSIIKTNLNKNSYIEDVELFKRYYLKDDTVFPLRKNGKNLEYFNLSWKQNIDNFIEDTILINIINTYLECIQSEEDDYEDFPDFKNHLMSYKRNLAYVKKLQTVKKYRTNLVKEILTLI